MEGIVFSNGLGIIVVFIIFSVIFTILFNMSKQNTKNKSNVSKNTISNTIGQTILNKRYVIKDFIIYKDNMFSKVDYLIVNKYGVFLILIKNESKYVTGNENDRNWSYVLDKGNTSYEFLNPIYEINQTVVNLFDYTNKLIPLIIFPFANLNININSVSVGNVNLLRHELNKNREVVLNEDEIKLTYEKLLSLQTNSNLDVNETSDNKDLCPLCGSKLLLRKGKYSSFYNCSKFPNCPYTKLN